MSLLEFLAVFEYRRTALGAVIIGIAAGMLGCHLYLRRQSMLADVVGHSSVAGVMGAFMGASMLSIDGRSMIVIVLGALVSGLFAVGLTNWVSSVSRVADDAAMAASLALFYGGGMVLLHMIQHSQLPNRGGIDELMFGKVSTLTSADNTTLGIIAFIVLLATILLHRPFQIMLFDPVMAKLVFSPRRVAVLSIIHMVLIVSAVVLGIKSVGLILIIAFAIFPSAAARQWTRSLGAMMALAAVFGAVGGVLGAWLSVVGQGMPAGPVMVLVLSVIVLVSLVAAPRRGLIARALRKSVVRS